MAVTPLELAKIAAAAADDKKATDILMLDLTDKSDVCDYFLICTVANNPMMNAVVEAVRHIIPGHLLDSVVRNGKLVL